MWRSATALYGALCEPGREIDYEMERFRAGLIEAPPRSVFLLWAGTYMGAIMSAVGAVIAFSTAPT
jgi:hypothetical protein